MMREIPLTQGQVALVDDEDFERLSVYKWHAVRTGRTFYAARHGPKPDYRMIYMHHEVMGGKPESGFEADHIDGDDLNNQKSNLRWVTVNQNQMNQHRIRGVSRFKGVSRSYNRNKWRVHITLNGRPRHVGSFTSEEDAARAYDAAALKHFGEYARLNFG